MSYVIDRRLNGKNKSTVNRQRFLRRYRDHIKKAVEEAVGRRSITDMEHGEQISNAFSCRGGIYPSDGRQLKMSVRYDF